jgi:hypothetical protein
MQVRQGQVEEWVLRLERELVQVLEQVSVQQVRYQQALVLAEEQVEVLGPGQV